MSNIFTHGTMPTIEQVISFTEARQRVIADNIANVDTTGYHAKDLAVDQFQAELARAVDEKRSRDLKYLPFGMTENLGVAANGMVRPDVMELTADKAGPMRHDGNNVSIDHEMVKLSSNAMMHNAMIQILTKEFSMLNTAITERIS